MKKVMPVFVVFVFIAIIVGVFLSLEHTQKMTVIKEGNKDRVALKMKVGKYQDSFCGMVIDDLDFASQVVSKSGKTWFFHDHADFVEWLKDKKFKDSVVIWVMSRDTHRWIDGKKAYYSVDEETPMHSGFGAYEHKKENLIDFDEMRLRVLRGETMQNPKIRRKLLHGNS